VELALRRLVAPSHIWKVLEATYSFLISVAPADADARLDLSQEGFVSKLAEHTKDWISALSSRMLARQARASSWSSIDSYETSSWLRLALKKIQYPLTRQLWR